MQSSVVADLTSRSSDLRFVPLVFLSFNENHQCHEIFYAKK